MEAAVAIWMMTGMTKAEERCGHCCSAKVVATINIEMVNVDFFVFFIQNFLTKMEDIFHF